MSRLRSLALGATLFTALLAAPLGTQAASPGPAARYKAPRTAFGTPDIGGDWTNVSMTPESRPPSLSGPVYTPEQVHKIEGAADAFAQKEARPGDPNAPAPKAGGDSDGLRAKDSRPEFVAAGGAVGGYDYGWLDPGTRIMRVGGEPRTSIITTPNGQAPASLRSAAAPEAEEVSEGSTRGGLGSMENVENRSLGERCIMGFGRNAGPPMLANGFYNNDYKIVQTKADVAIEVEMVHDVRDIRIGGKHRTDGVRPWMGDTIGHWEGDTLVAETTNIPKAMAYHGAWKQLTVTERFTRVGPDRLLYQFTVADPTVWAQPWGGEYEFHPLKGDLYEYACHEGNYALEHILAGARAEEAKAATGKTDKGS